MLNAALQRRSSGGARRLLNSCERCFSSVPRRGRGLRAAVTATAPQQSPRDITHRLEPFELRQSPVESGSGTGKPLSNRAAFRAVPLDAKVRSHTNSPYVCAVPLFNVTNVPGPRLQTLSRIEELKLCTDTSAAGRIARRSRALGDQRQLTRRYPLYGCAYDLNSGCDRLWMGFALCRVTT